MSPCSMAPTSVDVACLDFKTASFTFGNFRFVKGIYAHVNVKDICPCKYYASMAPDKMSCLELSWQCGCFYDYGSTS